MTIVESILTLLLFTSVLILWLQSRIIGDQRQGIQELIDFNKRLYSENKRLAEKRQQAHLRVVK